MRGFSLLPAGGLGGGLVEPLSNTGSFFTTTSSPAPVRIGAAIHETERREKKRHKINLFILYSMTEPTQYKAKMVPQSRWQEFFIL